MNIIQEKILELYKKLGYSQPAPMTKLSAVQAEYILTRLTYIQKLLYDSENDIEKQICLAVKLVDLGFTIGVWMNIDIEKYFLAANEIQLLNGHDQCRIMKKMIAEDAAAAKGLMN